MRKRDGEPLQVMIVLFTKFFEILEQSKTMRFCFEKVRLKEIKKGVGNFFILYSFCRCYFLI